MVFNWFRKLVGRKKVLDEANLGSLGIKVLGESRLKEHMEDVGNLLDEFEKDLSQLKPLEKMEQFHKRLHLIHSLIQTICLPRGQAKTDQWFGKLFEGWNRLHSLILDGLTTMQLRIRDTGNIKRQELVANIETILIQDCFPKAWNILAVCFGKESWDLGVKAAVIHQYAQPGFRPLIPTGGLETKRLPPGSEPSAERLDEGVPQ